MNTINEIIPTKEMSKKTTHYASQIEESIHSKLQRIALQIRPLLNEELPNMVYYASGTHVNNEYNNLPYNVFLIDYSFSKEFQYFGNNVFAIKCDALEFAFMAKYYLRISINTSLVLCPGYSEGNARMQLDGLSSSWLNMCADPDEYVHITAPDMYWKHNKRDYFQSMDNYNFVKNWMDVGYNEIEEISVPFGLNIFSHSTYHIKMTKAYRLTHLSKKRHSFFLNGIKFTLKHKSIYSEMDQLDLGLVRFENTYQKSLIQQFYPQALPMHFQKRIRVNFTKFENYETPYKSFNLDEAAKLCSQNNYKKIGLIPNKHNIERLSGTFANSGVEEIILYHIHKDDYAELYQL